MGPFFFNTLTLALSLPGRGKDKGGALVTAKFVPNTLAPLTKRGLGNTPFRKEGHA